MSLIAGRQISGSVASASYATTASFALNGGGSSIDTGSFATTGSNRFIGNQIITGSLSQGLEGNIISGEYSHAEGSITKAIGDYSHAEGDNTQAIGNYSHAEGIETIASGGYSHAEGYQTIALANYQHVQGQYNAISSVQSAFIVGNGTDTNNRSNLIYAAGNEVQISGSLLVSGSITGSLFGTASYATTASYVINALTASYVQNAQTASYVLQAVSSSFATTSSYASTAQTLLGSVVSASYSATSSYALNGGVTQLLAGPNILLSPTNGLGQVTISSTGGSSSFNTATGSYGSFYSTVTQTNVAGTARSMSLNITDITNGVSVSGSTDPYNTYIKTENAGVYNIQFSAQIDKTDSGTDEIWIWLRKNGTNLTDTATSTQLVGNGAHYVAAWNFFANAAADDYFQLMWYSPDANVRLHAEPAFGVVPGIPSLIVTANRIDQFLSNTGSFSGSFTGIATTASYVQNAQSASYALTAETLLGSVVSASYAVTASLAQSVAFEGKPLSAGWPNNYTIPAKLTTPIISLAGAATTDTTANIRYYPIQLSRDTLISSIGALVRGTLVSNTGSYRLGIYNSIEASTPLVQGSTALPGTLLADYGLISQIGTAQAFVQIAIADVNRPTLKKGEIYWLAISPSGSTTQALGPPNATAWSDYFGITPSTTTVASYIGLSVTADGGAALPNPANTSSIALLSTTNMKGFPILKITGSIV